MEMPNTASSSGGVEAFLEGQHEALEHVLLDDDAFESSPRSATAAAR